MDKKTYNASIYPNPTSQSLFVKSNQYISDIYIYNALGEELLTLKNIKETSVEIKEIKNLIPGAYTIKIGFTGNDFETQKFIKL